MKIRMTINGKLHETKVSPSDMLIDVVRKLGYTGTKRGCDTTNCGLCTVLVDNKPILSCSYPAYRADEKAITTIEGVQTEATILGGFLAMEGSDQCGFCTPGLVMNTIAMKKELSYPDDEAIKHYLAGNLCRCTGYEGQMRAIRKYLEVTK